MNEEEAFVNFALANPGNVTLLIDTYDTLRGARKVVTIAGALKERGIDVKAVRLDSGDILTLSKEVRTILDEGGLTATRIFVSGNMDEYTIEALLSGGAPIDGFGVGTKLDTSDDSPYLECAYKLMEYEGQARMKKSTGKVTWPGRKQIFRRYEGDVMTEDILTLASDDGIGIPLMEQYMTGGRRIGAPRALPEIALYAKEQIESLPPYLRKLRIDQSYPVRISPAVIQLKEHVEALL
jgi:nicotinate phosphoribosyltransferase